MNWSRREIVLAGLGLFAAGCSSHDKGLFPSAPGAVFRSPDDPMAMPRAPRPTQPHPRHTPAPQPAPRAGNVIHVIPRNSWAKQSTVVSRVNLMGSVDRITIHHEGCREPIEFSDVRNASQRLELIRTVHVRDRGWGDIGYHFIIDRGGRVYEGRPLQYQGAHVKNNNEHNVGIMLMGNFDLQRPTDAQIAQLQQLTVGLRRQHNIRMDKVRTHQEINPTRCPGALLQRQIVSLRSNGYLV